MRLERVDVARLRGGPAGFRLEAVAPGLNLVVGPNGSGKSSLCAAIRSTLWPDAGAVEGAELAAFWACDGGSARASDVLRAELVAAGRGAPPRVDWQRDGAPADRPPLPGSHLAPVYVLGMRDLLADDHTTDRDLAERIRVEMSGGFDVGALRSAPRGRAGRSRHGHAEERALREARDALHRLEGERAQLAREADRVEGLKLRRERAEAAQAEIEPLSAAAELAGLRETLAQCDERLAALAAPAARLDALRGDEREALDALAAEHEAAVAEHAEAARVVSGLEASRREFEVPDPPPDASARAVLRDLARALTDAEADRRASATSLSEARHESEAAAALLRADANPEALSALDASAVERAAGWVGRAVSLRAQRAELAGRIEASDVSGAGGDPDALAAATDAWRRRADMLRDWLASPVAAPEPSPGGPGVALAGALAFAGVFGLLVLSDGAWSRAWALLLLVPGAVCGWALARLLAPRDERSGARRAIEARWRELHAHGSQEAGADAGDAGLATLDFEAPRVREALAGIDDRIAELRRRHAEAIALGERRRELAALDADAAELAESRAALARRIGADPGLGEPGFADLLDRVRRFRDAELRCARAAREHAEREATCADTAEQLAAALPPERVPASSPDAGRPGVLVAATEALLEACRRDADLAERLVQAEAGEQAAAERVGRVGAKRAAVLARAGLPEDASDAAARAALEDLLGERVQYLAIREDRRAAAGRAVELERRLEAHPRLGKLERADAEARLEEARARAAELASLAEEIARIEERVEAAAASGALEAARAEVARAEGALAASRDALLAELAGDFLLDEIEDEYERDTRPALLEAASDLFARFTRHRYRLEVARSEAGGGFRAVETASGRGLSLAELSDGTRMQLLLAARLAFALHAEAGEHPPVFLDEALTASDPERFRAVADGLLELAAEGRQIFYLTCNPSDVALFEHICAEAGAPRPPVFDLGRLRGAAAAIDDEAMLALPPRIEVPAPGDDGPEAYAMRLGVPEPAPGEGIEALHLFHVLRDDLDLLHRLLAGARIERVGHWYSLRGTPAVGAVLSPAEQARVDAAVGVAARFLAAHGIGRGQPVDRAVLEQSGAVSERFIDEVTKLARAVKGDARALIAALESGQVARFHTNKREELRDALEASGHLDPATPLAPEALRARALAGLAPGTAGAGGLDLAGAQRLVDWLEKLLDEPG